MNLAGLLKKYKGVATYLFFGGCTTAVNVAAYWLMTSVFNCANLPGVAAAWALAVLFAFATNRRWVFKSEAKGIREVLKEAALFYICRIATGAVDIAGMWLLVDVLNLNGVAMKFLANLLVIVLNYMASKAIIFKHKGESDNDGI